jgi:hypothetical protein
MDGGVELLRLVILARKFHYGHGRLGVSLSPPGGVQHQPETDLDGHPVQQPIEGGRVVDRVVRSNQGEESGLEGVLGFGLAELVAVTPQPTGRGGEPILRTRPDSRRANMSVSNVSKSIVVLYFRITAGSRHTDPSNDLVRAAITC